MPKTITVRDIRPINFTLQWLGDGRLVLSCRYERLDESDQPIAEFQGNLVRDVPEGGRRNAIENFVRQQVVPFIREQEGL